RGHQAEGDRAHRSRKIAVPHRRARGFRGHRALGGRLQERGRGRVLRPELLDRQGQDVQVPVRQQPHALPDGGGVCPLRGRSEDGQEVAHARQQLLVAADDRARLLDRGQAGGRRLDGRHLGAAGHARLPAVPAQGGRGEGRRRLRHHVGRRPGGRRQAGAGVRARPAIAGLPHDHRADVRRGCRQGRVRELLLGHAVVLAPQGQVPGREEVLRAPSGAAQAGAVRLRRLDVFHRPRAARHRARGQAARDREGQPGGRGPEVPVPQGTGVHPGVRPRERPGGLPLQGQVGLGDEDRVRLLRHRAGRGRRGRHGGLRQRGVRPEDAVEPADLTLFGYPLPIWYTQLFIGLVNGCILILVALGLSIVFGLMGIINFAHGIFYMLGAYAGWLTVQVLGNFWLALVVAPISVFVIGVVVERGILRRIYGTKNASFAGVLVTY